MAALVAATLVPAQSEAVLAALLLDGSRPAWLLVAMATAGNVLGSVVNWVLGRFLLHFRDRRWFPVSDRALTRAQVRYARWGHWSLLGSWLPVVGDPLTVAAGYARTSPLLFAAVVLPLRVARYVALAAAVRGWGG